MDCQDAKVALAKKGAKPVKYKDMVHGSESFTICLRAPHRVTAGDAESKLDSCMTIRKNLGYTYPMNSVNHKKYLYQTSRTGFVNIFMDWWLKNSVHEFGDMAEIQIIT